VKKGRDFLDWMRWRAGYDEARREAMQRAGTNSPQGSAYREEFAKIDRRERLRPQRWQGIPVTGGSHLLHQAVGKLRCAEL